MQVFAKTGDEKDEEEEEKKRKSGAEPGQSAAQRGPERSISRNLEDRRQRRTERGQLLHSVVSFHSFLCLFTHLLPSCMFFVCLSKDFKVIFLSKIKKFCFSLSCWSPDLLAIQGKDSAIELFEEAVRRTFIREDA